MDTSSLTVENIGAMAGVGLAALWMAAAKYMKERKAPPQQNAADVVVAGGTIADMGPIRQVAAELARIALSCEGIHQLMLQRAREEEMEEEIERRAQVLAAQQRNQGRARRAPP